MPPKYRLIAIDLDGTLLDRTGSVPPANREALRQAQDAGLAVCICTGRNHLESRDVLTALDRLPDGEVTVFGAVVCDPQTGRPLVVRTINRGAVRDAVAWFKRHDMSCIVTHEGYTAGFYSYAIANGRRDDGLQRWMQATVCRYRVVREWPADAPPPVRVGAIVTREAAAEYEPLFVRDFAGRLVGQAIHAPNYDIWVLEFFAPGVNKWTGLLPIAEERGIRPDQIVALGDDSNDVELVANAGLGVAMGNACPRVKAVADEIAPSNDEAGVAAVIRKVLDGA